MGAAGCIEMNNEYNIQNICLCCGPPSVMMRAEMLFPMQKERMNFGCMLFHLTIWMTMKIHIASSLFVFW